MNTAFFRYGSGFLTHWLASRRETIARRRAFRNLLSVQLDKLLDVVDTPDANLIETYKSSRPVVRDECAKILADIRRSQIDRFRSTRAAYLELKEADIENRNTKAMLAISRNVEERRHRRVNDYDLGRERLKMLLKGMIDCAK